MGKYDDCDFSGYVAKYGVLCDDGTKMAKGAFADQDGKTVTMVWNHDHDNMHNVIGHCALEERPDGLYGYAYLNDETDLGRAAKVRVKHGDLTAFSIWANRLQKAGRNAKDILHGVIKEVSLVVAGADPTSIIDTVVAHGINSDENGECLIHTPGESDSAFVMHSAYYNGDMTAEELNMINGEESEETPVTEEVQHAAPEPTTETKELGTETPNETIEHSAENASEDLTFSEVFKTLNETQKRMFIAAIAAEKEKNQNGGTIMHNLFEKNAENANTNENYVGAADKIAEAKKNANALVHSAFSTAEKFGYLGDAFVAHAAEYGIDNLEILFPDAEALYKEPEFIKRRTEWVADVLDGANHAPFSRIKSWFADITEDEARAKGYIKGNRKKEEVFKVLKRETSPTTVYKKQKFDRDDYKDITTLDALVWMKKEMKIMLEEELAVAVLLGDDRAYGNEDRVDPEKIRPIWTDDELFTVRIPISVTASSDIDAKPKALIRSLIKNRKLYYGSGNCTFFTTEDNQADMLLIDDGIGHPLYPTVTQLATRIRANKISTVQPMEGRSRVVDGKTHYLAGILVNMKDYTIGADKGGKVDFFEDFNLDYNQHLMLMETRCSGALQKPYSALVFEFVYDLMLVVNADLPASVRYGKTVSDLQSNVYVNGKSIQGELKYVSGWTEAYGSDPAENSGNFVSLTIEDTAGAYNTVQTIGGFHDDRVAEMGEDKFVVLHVKDNATKIIIRSTINKGQANEQTIEKVLSCSGLKLNRA